jgi:hypothetical protein
VTAQENSLHAYRAGLCKAIQGVDQHAAKLTPELIQKAKDLRKLGQSYEKIGKAIGVSNAAAHSALTGKTWKHLL